MTARAAESWYLDLELADLERRYVILDGCVRKLSALTVGECMQLLRKCIQQKKRIQLLDGMTNFGELELWYLLNSILMDKYGRNRLTLYQSRQEAEQALKAKKKR